MRFTLQTLREPLLLSLIALLSGALAFTTIDAGRARLDLRKGEIERAVRDASSIASFPRAIRVDSISPDRSSIEFSITNKKLGATTRLRGTLRDDVRILDYAPQYASDGAITGFAPRTDLTPADLSAGTEVIASFIVTKDGAFTIDRIVTGIELAEP